MKRENTEVYGLDRLVTKAKSGAMKEVARVAVARGLSLSGIARAFNASEPDDTKVTLSAKNVEWHFRSRHPRASTLAAYARLLQVPLVLLTLADGTPLSPNRLREVVDDMRDAMQFVRPEFEDRAIDSVLDAIRSADEAERNRLASVFELARLRALYTPSFDHPRLDRAIAKRFGEEAATLNAARYSRSFDDSDLDATLVERCSKPVAALAKALLPTIDLGARLLPQSDDDEVADGDALVGLWLHLRGPASLVRLDDAGARRIIRSTVTLLHKRGRDTTPMEASFRSFLHSIKQHDQTQPKESQ